MTSTGRGPAAPEPPSGEIVLQPPPEIEDDESSGGVLTSAIPMLGSLGSVAVMATMGSPTSQGQERSLLAAGMFLVSTVGFVLVQLDRHRTSRLRRVNGARTAYLRYLGTVRALAREAAAQQRAALVWRHPDPADLPSLAEERSRVWEHSVTDSEFLQVRYGVRSQPLSLGLVAPDSTSTDRVDPAAAAALHRLLAVHRVQPHLPATVDLRSSDRIEICGAAEEARALARAMICSAAAFQSPRHLAIAVLASEDALAEWDWVKWLPHAHSHHRCDAVGPRRMVSTDLAELAPLLPADAHALFVVDGGILPPDRLPPRDGRSGVTVLELPDRWDEPDDSADLRLLLDDRQAPAAGGRPMRVLGLDDVTWCARRPTSATSRPPRPSPDGSRRCTVTDGSTVEPTTADGTTDLVDLLGLPDVHRYDPASGWRSRPAGDRLRVPIGLADGGEPIHLDLKEAAQQGMGPHGLVDRRDGLGQVRAPPHPRARPGADPLPRGAEPGAGRLQGRRDVRRDVGPAPRLGRDHQPRRRPHPGRPHAGRAVRRAGAPPGGAACRRRPRLGPRLRAGARCRRRPRAPAGTVRRGRRVLRAARGQARAHRPVRRDRPARSLARAAPAAGLAAARGGAAAGSRVAPVLPDRAAHVLRAGVADGARRPGCLRAAADARAGVPQDGPVDPAAVHGRVRLRAGRRSCAGRRPRGARRSRGILPWTITRGAAARTPRTAVHRRARAARRRARSGRSRW